MKVIDPNNTSHTLVLIPRYYPTNSLTLEITEEASGVSESIANTYSITDGELSIEFTYDFTGKDKYSLKLNENTEVVYRGKLIVTDKQAQDYKLTNGLYYYE